MMDETPREIFLPAKCDSADCPNKGPRQVNLTKGFCNFCGHDDSAYVLADNINYELDRLYFHLGCLKVAVRGDV